MPAGMQWTSRPEPRTPQPAAGAWCERKLSTVKEMGGLLEDVARGMESQGYCDRDVFAMRLALEEAAVNGIKHGHRGDPSRELRVRYRVDADRVLAEVEDQGPGFDPRQVPDPLAPENLERPGGRGLLLMRSFLTWVRYNGRGNRVVLCKCRSSAQRQ